MKKRVAVIGGGLTGLVVAYRLGQKGYKVSLFEKADKLGGLLSSFRLKKTYLEKTYHHIFKTDKEIIGLINELGLGDKLIWRKSSIGLYCKEKLYPFMSPVDLLKFRPLGLVDKLRTGLVGLYLQKINNCEKFKNVTACKWMKEKCGRKAYKIIWEPLLKGKFDKYYKQVSMAWLWARIHVRGKSNEGMGKEYLGYLDGGFQLLVDELSKRIRSNKGKILLGKRVNKIMGNKVFVGKKSYNFEKIICCTPSNVFADLIKINSEISKNYLKKLKSIKYLGALNVLFVSKQSLSRYYWHNINDLKSPFLAFIQHTNLIGKKQYEGKHMYYLGTYLSQEDKLWNMKDSEIYGLFFAFLKKIFPFFEENGIEKKYLFRFKEAQHLVDCDYEKKIAAYKTPLKNVWLFNFSQIFPEDRGISYAVREGNKVIKELG
ncbi:NAD(P)/FAD-dependent oxidoreductase [Patescibacteria group bacterium]|nr:NAD(P)/FAD-dependent oxidoreductase [Patescibacteria group bacterium]